ncbi:MAG: CorA family divalent cation transporter, partial [Bacteroidota bacterium]
MNTRKKNVGLPPGAVVFTGQQKVEQARIHYLQYASDSCLEEELDVEKRQTFPASPVDMVDWYDVRGLHDDALIERIGKTYEIHPLVLEDIPDVNQRPKFEEHTGGIFVTIKALSFDQESERVQQEHVAVYCKAGLVISFQETNSDLFAEVRRRINEGYGRIRRKRGDYLAYALLDAITDNYFLVLEAVEDRIEELEEKLLDEPEANDKTRI